MAVIYHSSFKYLQCCVLIYLYLYRNGTMLYPKYFGDCSCHPWLCKYFQTVFVQPLSLRHRTYAMDSSVELLLLDCAFFSLPCLPFSEDFGFYIFQITVDTGSTSKGGNHAIGICLFDPMHPEWLLVESIAILHRDLPMKSWAHFMG